MMIISTFDNIVYLEERLRWEGLWVQVNNFLYSFYHNFKEWCWYFCYKRDCHLFSGAGGSAEKDKKIEIDRERKKKLAVM